MDDAYLQAAIPEPCCIFGLRLLPLSITRCRLLERFGCAFMTPSAEADMGDLLLGVLICSMPVHDFLEFVASPQWDPELRRWGERIREEMASDGYFNLSEKFGLFQAYLARSSKAPDYWDESEGKNESGGHWLQNLELSLRSKLNYTSQEIDDGPLSKALADVLHYAESQGAIRLIRPEELEKSASNTAILQAFAKGALCPA